MTTLFDPVRLGDLDLSNRIVMAPMTRSRAGDGDVPTDLNVEYYRQRATAGLIVSDGVAGAIESLVKSTASEQSDSLPAASVAVALQLVVVLASAVTERPEANAAALPVATGDPVQVALLKSLIVEPASALPATVTAVAGDGEAGETDSELGAPGAIVSLVKLTADEQAETLPAASVAFALQVLVELSPAVTEIPAAKSASVPLATAEPVQVAPLKIFTVEPLSALPVIVTAVAVDGDVGEIASELGASGGVESLT